MNSENIIDWSEKIGIIFNLYRKVFLVLAGLECEKIESIELYFARLSILLNLNSIALLFN